MMRASKNYPSACLAGAGFLWGWSFLFFFASQFDSTVSPLFWIGDVTYLGMTLLTSLVVVAISRRHCVSSHLGKMGAGAFGLMLAGSVLLAAAQGLDNGWLCAMAGKALAGPGQGLFWISWTAALARFDIEKVETAFLQWIPLLVVILLASSFASSSPSALFQVVQVALIVILPCAIWIAFRMVLALPEEEEAPSAVSPDPYPLVSLSRKDIGSVLWLLANLSVALAAIMVAWNAFLYQQSPEMAPVKVVFSIGALVALPIVWAALRVTRRFGPSSLYRWAAPLMALGVLFNFMPGGSMAWSACLCLGIVSVGFEGMYHLAFIYVAKRFSCQATFVASLGVTATTLGGLLGSAAWASCLTRISSETVGLVLLASLFILVLCSACAPRSEGISGVEVQPGSASASCDVSTSLEGRCQIVSRQYGLTPRESEVLFLLVQGRSRAFIREMLFISKGTVDTHVHHIYSKMGIGSKDALVNIVLDQDPSDQGFR